MKKIKDKEKTTGFFSFTKNKIILSILLYLPPIFLPQYIELTNKNILFYLYLIPTYISQNIIKIFSIGQEDFIFAAILKFLLFLIINIAYVYLISCTIVFIVNKLKNR